MSADAVCDVPSVCDDENLQVVFDEAKSYIKNMSSKLPEEQLLQFYGYYKQAVEGPCSKPKPNWYQIVEKQKWQAWSSLGNMDKKEAMEKYIELVNDINADWRSVVFDQPAGWVHHSCMEDEEDELDDSLKTAFDWVKENNLSKVVDLLNSGFDVNALDDNKLTLLHWAADRGNLEIVKCLIQDFKATVNVQDGDGQTPLHYAAFCDHEQVVEYLVKCGIDINVKDLDGNMAYDVTNDTNIKTLLSESGKG